MAPKNVKVIAQGSMSECGLVCLAMVMGAHDRHIPVREIRNGIDPGRDGATLLQLATFARSEGFIAHAVRLEAHQVDRLSLPAIVNWNPSHFVVLERVRRGRITIVDPAAGRSEYELSAFAEKFGGVALTFERGGNFKAVPRPGLQFTRFVWRYIPRAPGRIVGIAALALMLFLLSLVIPSISRYIFDNVLPGGATTALGGLVTALALVAATFFSWTLLRTELLLWLETRLDAAMMSDFMSRLLALPYRYFQIRHIGDILTRVSSTAYVRDLLSGRLISVAIDSLFLLAYLAVIAFQSFPVALVVTLIAALEVVVILSMAKKAQRLTERELASMSVSQGLLLETVRGVEMVKSAGLEAEAVERWATAFEGQLSASASRRRLDGLLSAFLTTVGIVTPLAVLVVAVTLVIEGELSVGEAIGLNALAAAALAPVGTLCLSVQALLTVRVHVDRLKDILDEEPEDDPGRGAPSALGGAISAKGVSYHYGGNAPASLSDVDVDIRPGEFVAVIGPSGSGKSTLARILVGLLKPNNGLLSFDGRPIDELDLNAVRKQCGVVTQASDAVSGSIQSNVVFGRPGVTSNDIVRALKAAALWDDVASMPLGLETPLGEAGIGLSGGQLQRLAIARAIVSKPKVLVLDEATSHLDAPTEARIASNLATMTCTRIVIAHRLSTIVNADTVIFLVGGRIVSVGPHAAQLRNRAYAAFFHSQSAR